MGLCENPCMNWCHVQTTETHETLWMLHYPQVCSIPTSRHGTKVWRKRVRREIKVVWFVWVLKFIYFCDCFMGRKLQTLIHRVVLRGSMWHRGEQARLCDFLWQNMQKGNSFWTNAVNIFGVCKMSSLLLTLCLVCKIHVLSHVTCLEKHVMICGIQFLTHENSIQF